MSRASALDVIPLIMAAGDCREMQYTESRNGKKYLNRVINIKSCHLTITLTCSPRTAEFVRFHQGNALFFNQDICFRNWILAHAAFCSLPPLPASLFKPSRPTTTQEALQRPQTRRSFPSLIQPHFEAATASIAEGLLA